MDINPTQFIIISSFINYKLLRPYKINQSLIIFIQFSVILLVLIHTYKSEWWILRALFKSIRLESPFLSLSIATFTWIYLFTLKIDSYSYFTLCLFSIIITSIEYEFLLIFSLSSYSSRLLHTHITQFYLSRSIFYFFLFCPFRMRLNR